MIIKRNKNADEVVVDVSLVNDYQFTFTKAEFDELKSKGDDALWDYINGVISEGDLEPDSTELRIEQ